MTTKTEVLKAIREKCLDCSVYQVSEVEKCPATACALHPFRFGKDPSPAKKGMRTGFAVHSKVNLQSGTKETSKTT